MNCSARIDAAADCATIGLAPLAVQVVGLILLLVPVIPRYIGLLVGAGGLIASMVVLSLAQDCIYGSFELNGTALACPMTVQDAAHIISNEYLLFTGTCGVAILTGVMAKRRWL